MWLRMKCLSTAQKSMLCLIALTALVDIIWLPQTRLTFDAWNLAVFIGLFFLLASLHYKHRRYPVLYKNLNLVIDLVLLVFFSIAGLILSYLVFAYSGDFSDKKLSEIDHALGFEWSVYTLYFLHEFYFWLVTLLLYILIPVWVLALIVQLHRNGKHQAASNYVLMVSLGGICCILIAAILPSIGAIGYYQVGAEFFQGYPALFDDQYKAQLLALRANAMPPIRLWQPLMVIAFPSYHACLAVMTILASRWAGHWYWKMLILNGLGLATLPVQGGHHLVDVIGGMFIGGVIYHIVRYSYGAGELTKRETNPRILRKKTST